MILADTSIWIDHLRAGEPRLASALDAWSVCVHPFVIGELACGTIGKRGEVLGLLGELPTAPVATDAEVLTFIEQRRLMGRGLGYIDMHLLASAVLLAGSRLWTRDRRLADVATQLGIGFA